MDSNIYTLMKLMKFFECTRLTTLEVKLSKRLFLKVIGLGDISAKNSFMHLLSKAICTGLPLTSFQAKICKKNICMKSDK